MNNTIVVITIETMIVGQNFSCDISNQLLFRIKIRLSVRQILRGRHRQFFYSIRDTLFAKPRNDKIQINSDMRPITAIRQGKVKRMMVIRPKSLLPQKSVFCPKSLFAFSSHSLITIYNHSL